jgi:hypothetical protein
MLRCLRFDPGLLIYIIPSDLQQFINYERSWDFVTIRPRYDYTPRDPRC